MATALVLGRKGHKVYATMRNPNHSPELAQTAEKEGLPITVSKMDVDSDDSVKEAIGAIHKEHGPIDVLVNNAGIERRGSTEELDLSHFRAVMETNYFGALRCIQAVLPQMRARKSGCIINVTSVAGRISASPLGSYAASKFALEALSEALAQEAKMFNIRVAIVQPGIIDTAMARRMVEQPSASAYPQMRRLQVCSPRRCNTRHRPRWSGRRFSTLSKATVGNCGIRSDPMLSPSSNGAPP
jgi:NAD(P)-dependent dehydrogenase (short-subunit alcohol dehydrogenase family)